MNAKVFDSTVNPAMFAVEIERAGIAVLDIPSTHAGTEIKKSVEKQLRALRLRRVKHYYVADACAFVYFDPDKLADACSDVATRHA